MMGAALVVLGLATASAGGAQAQLTLELRVFNGGEEVTADSRVTVYRAGERNDAIARIVAHKGPLLVPVPPGFYDVQVIREKDGKVLNIRWAERLVVMPYPDEDGRHLEVINFSSGFGALQIRAKEPTVPNVALFAASNRDREVAERTMGDSYALFVVPAGTYELRVGDPARPDWHSGIEIPLDRTRLWIAP